MNITLVRDYDKELTDGELFDENKKHICYTLELPDKGNKPEVSCIPEGTYKFHKMFSSHLGWVYMLNKVPNRQLIEIHVGNTVLDIRGCILVGTKQGTINIKGRIYPAVLNSKEAIAKLFAIVGTEGTITIRGQNEKTRE